MAEQGDGDIDVDSHYYESLDSFAAASVEEVEEVLRAHPDVADALVVGWSSQRWGDEVVAVVGARPGARIDEPMLRQWCTAELAGFKAPKAFIVVDAVQPLGQRQD